MMATHGCGQRTGFKRFLGWAALVALVSGGVPGPARACHLRHAKATANHTTLGAESATPASGSSAPVQSQQILTPTSLVPQVPPLTPTTAPVITAPAAPAPVMTIPVTALTPSPVTNPPAAEQIVPSAPPAIATWHDAGTPTCTTTVPLTPPTNVPVTTPPAAQALNPPAPLLPPLAANTPEPASIVSALVMIGAATAWRRSRRRVG